jgi:hypothetical protein
LATKDQETKANKVSRKARPQKETPASCHLLTDERIHTYFSTADNSEQGRLLLHSLMCATVKELREIIETEKSYPTAPEHATP